MQYIIIFLLLFNFIYAIDNKNIDVNKTINIFTPLKNAINQKPDSNKTSLITDGIKQIQEQENNGFFDKIRKLAVLFFINGVTVVLNLNNEAHIDYASKWDAFEKKYMCDRVITDEEVKQEVKLWKESIKKYLKQQKEEITNNNGKKSILAPDEDIRLLKQ